MEILDKYNQFALFFHLSQDILHSVLLRYKDLKMEEDFRDIDKILRSLILKLLPQEEKRIILLRLIYRRYCQIIFKNHPILFYSQENEKWSYFLSKNHKITNIFRYVESFSSNSGYFDSNEEFYFNFCRIIKSTIHKKFKSENLYGLKINGKKTILKLKKQIVKLQIIFTMKDCIGTYSDDGKWIHHNIIPAFQNIPMNF